MKMESSELNSSAQSTLHAEQVDILPGEEEGIPSSKIYEPLSFPVIALLMAPAVFGVLARLALVALATYNGESVFPLAYAQALGCLIMGFSLRLKEPLGQLYVRLLCNAHTNFLITAAVMLLYTLH
jgi:CrcB protein